jgi:hypothetical protein
MLRFEGLIANLVSTSLELKECVAKFFPKVSEEFLKRFLMDKIFNNYDRRK